MIINIDNPELGSKDELQDLVDDIHCRFPTVDVISAILAHTKNRLSNPHLSIYMRALLSDYGTCLQDIDCRWTSQIALYFKNMEVEIEDE